MLSERALGLPTRVIVGYFPGPAERAGAERLALVAGDATQWDLERFRKHPVVLCEPFAGESAVGVAEVRPLGSSGAEVAIRLGTSAAVPNREQVDACIEEGFLLAGLRFHENSLLSVELHTLPAAFGDDVVDSLEATSAASEPRHDSELAPLAARHTKQPTKDESPMTSQSTVHLDVRDQFSSRAIDETDPVVRARLELQERYTVAGCVTDAERERAREEARRSEERATLLDELRATRNNRADELDATDSVVRARLELQARRAGEVPAEQPDARRSTHLDGLSDELETVVRARLGAQERLYR